MRLGDIWDYFMRRKWLLLMAIIILIIVVAIRCKNGFSRLSETMEIEVPKTGEISLTGDELAGCSVETVDRSGIIFGNGKNDTEEIDNPDRETTFWEEETPTAMIEAKNSEVKDGKRVESIIITLGILAAIAVLGVGKFTFDRYVR